ncbi:MAG: DUF927 domain-containing protein, partial [Rhodocyclaceae bacterium]|nr:DUF927 domain-containing protein [Rhodocyclaceae bacterium]
MTGKDFRTVAAAALARFDQVADWLGLAGGKNQGREYLPLNPKRADTKPGSFTINRDFGAWADFASGDKGGDLVSLAAYLFGCRQGEAAGRLAEFLGLPGGATEKRPAAGAMPPADGKAPARPEKPRQGPPLRPAAPSEVCIMPIPEDAPPPPAVHSRHGRPAHRWAYTTAEGAPCFFHDRYEPAGERKQFAPLTLWRRPDGRMAWQFKAPPAPRPLYGLPDLAGKPGPAVIVEGEKAADAAALLLPAHAVLTWQGGAQAVAKADFSPLAGREVWLWPDNDAAGEKAARDVAAALAAAGAGPVRRFELGAFAAVPGMQDGAAILGAGAPMAPGDDAADLAARGWTAEHLALIFARPDTLRPVSTASGTTAEDGQNRGTRGEADTPAPPQGRRFELSDKGVHYFEPDRPPRWVCAPLAVAAMVRDPRNAGWGLLVEFSDPDRHAHRIIVPMVLFRGDGAEVAGLLLDRGLKIAPRARPLLLEYLQTSGTRHRARITGRTGWHESGEDGAVFILPDQAIGPAAGEWIFEGEGGATTYTLRGTLAGWRQDVAALCRGNSRLLFAVSVAFAAPLLYLAGAEGGGFHFRSHSSDGKTTALRVSASVCGGPEFMQRWRATDNGLEALAMQHCDAPLLLDELAQIDPRAAGEVAYMLANGGGKARAGRTGGARERTTWRVLFLSAGEIGLSEHMGEIGKAPRAGQELRLAEIPADAGAGLGIFEALHGFKGGADLAKAITEAARRNHGGAFVAFLSELARHQHEVAETVKDATRQFQAATLTDQAHGQARRVADRFALVGAAGELATQWGITAWEPGEAMRAAVACFKAWMARRGGEGNQEDRAAIAQVREFLRRYGESAFSDWERPANDSDKHAPVRSDRAGYRRHNPETD